MAKLRSRVTLVEDALPLKADKAALEAAIQEFRDEIKKLNIEESLSFTFCDRIHRFQFWPRSRRPTSALI
jgi:hypothetical protein